MKGHMKAYSVKKSTKVKPANGPLTPTPDVGHGIKNRGKYSSNRIPDRVPKTGSGGKGSGPDNGSGSGKMSYGKKMKY